MDQDLQIPPATSPLLLPSRAREQRLNGTPHYGTGTDDDGDDGDNLDELEFLAPGNWEEREDKFPGDEDEREGKSEDGEEDELDDFSLEDGRIAGVPSSTFKLDAKQYQTPDFATVILELLRDELAIPGWATLPFDVPSSLIHIHKVSGALTNAVFFVSIPVTPVEITPAPPESARKVIERATPLSFATELGRSSTPTPTSVSADELRTTNGTETITMLIEAPTTLLRIYGPSSGALISRKTELHILHTLSSEYSIGPKVLGTFSNGRVEEFFHSRALRTEEMRDPRISRWIGRRMRELHGVELGIMVLPGSSTETRSQSRSRGRAHHEDGKKEGGLDPSSASTTAAHSNRGGRSNSIASVYSSPSGSSVFSFGASTFYSSSSAGGSTSSLATLNSVHGTPNGTSPRLLPRRGTTESQAERKKRSRRVMSHSGQQTSDKLGVWENITRWTREAKLVLKELDQLAQLPGFQGGSETPSPPRGSSTPNGVLGGSSSSEHVPPLSSAAATFQLRAALNLPLFEQEVKLYRTFVKEWEKREGKSRRVFSHNDTQYGNLLLLTPPGGKGELEAEEKSLLPPHQRIIVVDFEYASANPRGFDIANHFVEWQADYHHPTLAHCLHSHAPYPTPSERRRFLRAYVGCDAGYDGPSSPPSPLSPSPLSSTSTSASNSSSTTNANLNGHEIENDHETEQDARVHRLEAEVKIWEPSSHAMWAVWGIVQAKEDLVGRIEKWKRDTLEAEARKRARRGMKGLSLEEYEEDGAQGREVVQFEFDYLTYSLGRITMFRKQLRELGVLE